MLSANTARGVDPNRTMSQYAVERWRAEQGFPSAPVYAIGQAGDGYLVISTPNGMLRFDGLNFAPLHAADVDTLLNHVVNLVTDAQGVLWLRLSNAGITLLRYERGTFHNVVADLPTLLAVDGIARDRNGTAVCLVNRRVSASVGGRSAASGIVPCSRMSEASEPSKGFPRSAVLSTAQTSNGDFWLGTTDEGLFRVHDGQAESVNEGLPDLKVNALAPGVHDQLWVATDAGVVRWDGAKLTRVGIPASLRGLQVLSLLVDRDSNIWLGTASRGLLRLNEHGVSAVGGPDSVTSEAITALFEDREGNIWGGGGAGLLRLRDTPFIAYSAAEGLPAAGGGPIFADSAKRIWFGPVNAGLMWFRDEQRGRVSSDGIENDLVYSIAGRNDDLWIGRQRGGLSHLRDRGATFQSVTYTQANGLAQNNVYSVYEARDGTVWAGTLSAGVSRVAAGRLTTYSTANGLISNTINSIAEGHDGTMWFATPEGLSMLSQNRWQSFTTSEGLPSDETNCLLVDAHGVLWVGTAAGVAFHGPSGFKAPVNAPQSLKQPILGVAEDRFGMLWVASADSVLRVNLAGLEQGTLGEADVREYGLADGLRAGDGVKRDRSVVTDTSGRIWFSLNHGIVVVDPARLQDNGVPAIANIQSVSVDGKALNLQDGVHFSGSVQRIAFDYVGLSLAAPERVLYRYRLEGFENEWTARAPTRQANYTNLRHGSYLFRVEAANADGVWSARDATFAFQVDPMFWQTWWFQLSLAAGGIITLTALHRLRITLVAQQLNVRFEERINERTRIARNLHDTLLQSFHGLMLHLQAVSRLLPEGKAKEQFEETMGRADRAIAEGRSAVYDLRSSATLTNDIAEAVNAIGNELSKENDTAFTLTAEGPTRDLHPIIRDEIYRIAREALSNAFKHAHARQIEAEISYGPRMFRIRIRDDGEGIPAGVLEMGREGHFGLRGIRERAKEIGAELNLWSRLGTGTEIELSLPGATAYGTSPKRAWFRIFKQKGPEE